ncbi:MAG: hypothetical protein MUD14_25765 [Hydrococcus sp. Prado102]|nr:hypothetical protein [Hydrococcus sp. Prado102]
MTTGLTPPNSYYLELVNSFPPRPITKEDELIATQNRINSLLDKRKLTQDDRDYINVLAMLIHDYEEREEFIVKFENIKLLQNNFYKNIIGKFHKEKIRYVNHLTVYQKSDLEMAKAEIESAIDNTRLLIAIYALIGVISSNLIPSSAKFLGIVGSGWFIIYISVIGIFLYWQIAKQTSWLLVIKLAIAKKLKESESITGFQDWNDPEEDIYNAEF